MCSCTRRRDQHGVLPPHSQTACKCLTDTTCIMGLHGCICMGSVAVPQVNANLLYPVSQLDDSHVGNPAVYLLLPPIVVRRADLMTDHVDFCLFALATPTAWFHVLKLGHLEQIFTPHLLLYLPVCRSPTWPLKSRSSCTSHFL